MAQKLYYLGPKIWALLRKNIKDSEIINLFKSDVTLMNPENYLFSLYLTLTLPSLQLKPINVN